MATNPGRMTHRHDGDLAVFLIGMHIARWWRIDLWLPVLLAMPRMLRELHAATAAASRGEGPDLGFLDHRLLVGARGPTVVQYWRSTQDIYAYARSSDHEHRPAWTAFNARARKDPRAVGIWHETYAVRAGSHHSTYAAAPTMGLAKATSLIPAGRVPGDVRATRP